MADYHTRERYKVLADYQREQRQDWGSRFGGCAALPPKPDVHKLHAESMAYTARAREILRKQGLKAKAE